VLLALLAFATLGAGEISVRVESRIGVSETTAQAIAQRAAQVFERETGLHASVPGDAGRSAIMVSLRVIAGPVHIRVHAERGDAHLVSETNLSSDPVEWDSELRTVARALFGGLDRPGDAVPIESSIRTSTPTASVTVPLLLASGAGGFAASALVLAALRGHAQSDLEAGRQTDLEVQDSLRQVHSEGVAAGVLLSLAAVGMTSAIILYFAR
jgi:hypothetical protein